MTRQEILDFVRSNPTSFMATLDNGEPRVRGMQTAQISDGGLTFCTGTHKDICKQLLANEAVELAYWDESGGVMLRLHGRMEPVDSLDLKQEIVNTTFQFLKPVVKQHGYESLALFRFAGGEYKLWDRNQGGREETGTF